jgi:hypothetical protein
VRDSLGKLMKNFKMNPEFEYDTLQSKSPTTGTRLRKNLKRENSEIPTTLNSFKSQGHVKSNFSLDWSKVI